ncbi:MAG: ComF family protein [Planctomycetes bacterium]|nr:ComF family protein [Planctomycetota bacterium]
MELRSAAWRRTWRELRRAALDLLLPPACIACGVPARQFCGPCRRALRWRTGPACGRCGEPVLAAGDRCQGDHAELRRIWRLVAPLHYAGTGGALVRRFKLDADPAAARFLVRAMAAAWQPDADPAWRHALLVPVPLHPRRRRQRGFDQAAWLVGRLARALRLEPGVGILHRRRETLPQGDPRVLSRAGNVEGAFLVPRPARAVGRCVVLVDDVFTSGATARECAAQLLQAGAKGVAVLSACRS